MATHKHAALMQQYAQDWAETDKPWKRWEVAAPGDKFVSLSSHPHWNEQLKYRRKPRTMTYTVTIPVPLMEAPETGSWYWLAETFSDGFTSYLEWEGDDFEHSWLKRGLCFATKEDAVAAAKAMMPIKGEEA